MKFTKAVTLIALAICFSGCSNAQRIRTDAEVSQPERKVLIVYLSRTNNTEVVAEFIRDEVGGTMIPLELEIPGTTKLHRLEENLGAVDVELTAHDLREIESITSRVKVQGARYSEGSQKLVNR